MREIRIGNGFDVHQLIKGKKIKLCGIEIENDKKLIGHSDADVGLHSITDAILGALGKGDIGIWFPPDQKKWKDANSEIFLKKAIELMIIDEFFISNIDLTFICEKPKISLFRNKMIKVFSCYLKISSHH